MGLSSLVLVALSIVLLGGLDSLLGCLVGGLILAVGENLAGFYLNPFVPGIGGLFGMIWVELGRWLKRKWKNPWRSSKTMFCSEAVARVMVDSEYPGTKGWDVQSIDPEMLIEFFEKEQAG